MVNDLTCRNCRFLCPNRIDICQKFEPDMKTNNLFIHGVIKLPLMFWLNRTDERWHSKLLKYLRQNCIDYIDDRKHNNTTLWAGTPEREIESMMVVYGYFPEDSKPIWIDPDIIDGYAVAIGAI